MDKMVIYPKFKALTTAGDLASGYKLFTYEVGGTTKKTTYSDRALSTANTNPIVLDSRGETTGIFCTGTIKLALYPSTEAADPPTGSAEWTMDNLRVSYAASLADADGDTQIQVEESADEDVIRFDTGGTERSKIDANGLHLIKALQLGETTAPTTAASYGALYTKDENAQPELYYREESSGDSVELTKGGGVAVPSGYLNGLGLSNGTDTAHDINIAVGVCSDSTGLVTMRLASTMVKQIDAAWAAGSAAGGLFSGAVGNATWYHLFLIRKTADGTIDAGFDTSVTAANIPAGYAKYRRLGAVLTDGSANILAFTQWGDDFAWVDPPLCVNDDNPGTDVVDRTLTVPTGVVVFARCNVLAGAHAGAAVLAYVFPKDVTNEAPSATAAPLAGISSGTSAQWGVGMITVKTNTSGVVQSRLSASDATTYLRISTLGWTDRRGRD